MTEIIDLDNFLVNKKIIHSTTATKYIEGLTFFLNNEKNADIITYNSTINFLINNIDILKIDYRGLKYYEIPIERAGDIIDNIHLENTGDLNIEICYMIGNRLVTNEKIKEFSNKIKEIVKDSPLPDIEKNIDALLKSMFTKMELVTREEFDVQTEVLKRTRQKLEELEKKLSEIEARKK